MRLRTIFVSILMGVTACIIAALITWNVNTMHLTPLIEEVLKASFALVLIIRKKIVFLIEALVYGAAIGSGFALTENIIYIHYTPDMLFGTALFRGLSTALLHMGCTALIALALLHLHHQISSRFSFSFSFSLSFLFVFGGILLHYLYNLMLLAPFIQMVITILTILAVFLFVNICHERNIYQWLDHSITFDVQLLAAIRQGHLIDTPSGKYLQTIKDQFPPEVFFDLVCFLQLYLELTIEGKSRLLLREEGLAEPLTPSQQNLHKQKLTELRQLRRNIGPLGEHLLRPIISINDKDLRTI